jgi:hypothetical protein
MSPPEGCHPYREQIGAFALGKLEGGELAAVQTHLNSCPACRAEVGELRTVVAALADADPGRIDEYPRPPADLEESTFAPISEEIHRARRRRGRRFGRLAPVAAAILAVAIGLAGLNWLVEPAVAVEPLAFRVAPGVRPVGHLIAHASGTEIRLVVSGARDGQTYRVTLVSKGGERVDAGTFIGAGDAPVRGTFHAALQRKDAARLEVGTPGGEPAFFSKLPEEPRDKVRQWPLVGVLPWAEPDLPNKTMEPGGPGRKKGPGAEDTSASDTPGTPKAGGSGGGSPPPEENPPESGAKGSPSPVGEGPRTGPEGSEPARGPVPPSPPAPSASPGPSASPRPSDHCEGLSPEQQTSACGQYQPRL